MHLYSIPKLDGHFIGSLAIRGMIPIRERMGNMTKTNESILQKEAINALNLLSEDKLRLLIQFAKFLCSNDYDQTINISRVEPNINLEARKTAARELAGLWSNHDSSVSVDQTVRNLRRRRNFDI